MWLFLTQGICVQTTVKNQIFIFKILIFRLPRVRRNVTTTKPKMLMAHKKADFMGQKMPQPKFELLPAEKSFKNFAFEEEEDDYVHLYDGEGIHILIT
jgi:hypothetical protein